MLLLMNGQQRSRSNTDPTGKYCWFCSWNDFPWVGVDKDDDDDVHTGYVPGTPRSDESKDNDPAALCAVGFPCG